MSTRLTGVLKVKVDGAQERVVSGAGTMRMGGESRETVTGSGRVLGFTAENAAGAIEWEAAHAADTDLITLNETENATLLFESDAGVIYLLANAHRVGDPIELSGGGTYTVTFEGDPIEQL